jgi:hypothetical protein
MSGADMNVSLPARRCVHWLRAGFPACGGGRHGKKGAWQIDFVDLTCRRCIKIARAAAQKEKGV